MNTFPDSATGAGLDVNRAVITGIGCISAAGLGPTALQAAWRDGSPLGRSESVLTLRGRRREMRLARIVAFDREAHIPPSRLRRMEEMSQIWTIACLLARADAGFDSPGSAAVHPPEQRGTFLGTGFGCLDTTQRYLEELFGQGAGAASPFLFSQSVANAPAGHSAIELDSRGASVTFTCGDASAAVALSAGARAIEQGRATLAYCGGVELLPPPLLGVLASIGAPDFLGEACVCLVLESLDAARARAARIYAEVSGSASAADPACPATEWSCDADTLASAMRRALERSGRPAASTVFLHTCGEAAPAEAQRRAAASVCPQAEQVCPAEVFGNLAAAGGLGLAVSALHVFGADPTAVLTVASAWGGSVSAITLSSVSA